MTPPKQLKPRLGISSCLLGERVRYDGGHKLDLYLRDALGPFVEWVSVCPEEECGLAVPREAMRLAGSPAAARLITRETRIDHTDRMAAWAARRLDELERMGIRGFVLKARSPSCGLCVQIEDATGAGLFARALMERFPGLAISEDEALRDPLIRAEFLRRIGVQNIEK